MRGLLKTGGLIGVLKLLGAFSGLMLTLSVAWVFGASTRTDALFAALVLPAGVWQASVYMIAQVMVPYLVAAEGKGDDGMVAKMSLWLLSLGCGVAATALVVPEAIAAVVAPGLDATTAAEAASLLRVLAPVFPLTLLAGLATGMLYARKRFFAVECSQLIWKFAPLAVLAFPVARSIEALAWAISAGSAVRVALLLTYLDRGERAALAPRRRSACTSPELLRGLARTEALLMACDWAVQILCNAFASTLAPGALTLFNFADRIARTAPALVMRGIGVVLLPTLARRVREDADGGKAFVRAVLWPLGGFGLAAAAMGFALASPVAALFAWSGRMPVEQVAAFAGVLCGFAAGLPGMIVAMGLQSMFFLNLAGWPLVLPALLEMAVLAAAWMFLPVPSAASLAWVLAFALTLRTAALYVFFLARGSTSRPFPRIKGTQP